jgi:LmbE family N-acetylglucosaminyl deacetylase
MLGIDLSRDPNSTFHVLCLGAHSDDIEIGCGGTILRLIEEYPSSSFYWVVLGANQPQRADEALNSANAFLSQSSSKKIVVQGFRDSYFPYIGAEIKAYFEQLKHEISPDLIFTHYRDDLHQDHRLVCELTWNTFRNHLILEYEIPKYDGDLGSPNFFVRLDETICTKKTEYLLAHFGTQGNRHWFDEDTFLALMRLRGIESRAPARYAEAFYCRKLVL